MMRGWAPWLKAVADSAGIGAERRWWVRGRKWSLDHSELGGQETWCRWTLTWAAKSQSWLLVMTGP